MDNGQAPSRLYEKLLTISARNLKQLQELAKNEDNAMFKTLLKVQATQRISDHAQAIAELKLTKSQVTTFMRNAISSTNERSYRKIMINILANLVSRQFAAKKYKQCGESLLQLNTLIIEMNQLKQALYNLFQLNSLVALNKYKIESNAQFKYPSDTQIAFFYIVGKVKMASKKIQQARTAFQKILMLSNTTQVNQYMMLRVFDYLSDIKSSKYLTQYEKIKKYTPQAITVTPQEKQCNQRIIKTLLQKQQILINKTVQGEKEPLITKKMLWLYLSKLAYQNQNIQDTKYLNNLLANFNTENNPTVIREMLSANIAVQAQHFYNQKFVRLQQIILKYYFDKLTGKNKVKQNNSNVYYVPNKPKQAQKGKASIDYIVHHGSKVPLDINRANQILKKCSLGSYLMKINFGNNSRVRRFVRIQQKQFAWADDKMDIDSGSRVKWKHVLGIVYGKVSSNLSKPKFWQLQAWRCFSLITADRSYDFSCQQESDIFLWLQGISYKLQIFFKNQETYPFYSKGRALWKMAFMKMAAKYKTTSRKFKWQNAGAVISFKRQTQLHNK